MNEDAENSGRQQSLFPKIPEAVQLRLEEEPSGDEPPLALAMPPIDQTILDEAPQLKGGALIPDDEGLVSRVVKPHSAEKARRVSRYADVVGTAIAGKFRELVWIELYAGPGRLFEKKTGTYLPGSPLQALGIRRPFSRYILSDIDPTCVGCLRARTADRSNVHVLQGDANSDHLRREIASLVLPGSLVVVYLDPAELNLRFSTVRALASCFKAVDMIINLPSDGIARALAAGETEKASLVLDHNRPQEFLRHGRHYATIDAVREHFDEKLAELGFKTPSFRDTICQSGRERMLYDIIFATRSDMARRLYERSREALQRPEQLDLADFLPGTAPQIGGSRRHLRHV